MSDQGLPKVAVCISGVPRGEYCTELIRRIALNNDTYIFIWYWNDGNEILQRHSRRGSVPYSFDPQILAVPGTKLVCDSDKFENYQAEFQALKDKLPYFECNRQDLGIYGMTFAIKKANELREKYEQQNNFMFDCVIRARFESKFIQPGSTNYNPEAKLVVSDYDFSDKIYIPHTNVDLKYGMNDCLGFSNSQNMSNYSKVFDNIHELSCIEGHSPERIFYHNITKYNLYRCEQYVLVGF